MSEIAEDESGYLAAALQAARAARGFLEWMEEAGEQLAPERIGALVEETRGRFTERLQTVRASLDAKPPPQTFVPFAERLAAGFVDVERACELFLSCAEVFPPESFLRVISALHHCARAQETFYHLRHPLTSFAGFWQLPNVTSIDDVPRPAAEPPIGVIHVGKGGQHGGFSLYVPEYYEAARSWPVIVALHGGSGNGRDFLWTWLREAKSLGYILIAPNAVLDTWSEVEDQGLLQILNWVGSRYNLARDRVLLTGLSDGATFALLYGLAHPKVYRAIAPLCGVLHPANAIVGNLERAAGVPIYLVHGALDFLFPVQVARMARDNLQQAGAALTYRELPQLSHTYPRSENVRILRWFGEI
ncbi:MAG: phospholipase [Deltaproteobacteria bacterium]|nr:phospholipase [Deltaproteobacteria bacterium]